MLYLASRSPRRRELLARLGLAFEVLTLDVPEQRRPVEPAEDYVRRVAHEKALAGLAIVRHDPDALVLGADTEVVLEEQVFGKPADAGNALAMLRRLSGREHRVISAVSLVSVARSAQAVSMSKVRFAPLPEALMAAYVAGGEPFGKAGAYAIQGIAEAFVTQFDGSHSGVMGLPLHQTAQLLAPFGLGPMAPSGVVAAEAS